MGENAATVASALESLYLGPPDLQEAHHAPLRDGWYLATNNNSTRMTKLICAAAELAGLRRGSDLAISLGN